MRSGQANDRDLRRGRGDGRGRRGRHGLGNSWVFLSDDAGLKLAGAGRAAAAASLVPEVAGDGVVISWPAELRFGGGADVLGQGTAGVEPAAGGRVDGAGGFALE